MPFGYPNIIGGLDLVNNWGIILNILRSELGQGLKHSSTLSGKNIKTMLLANI